MSAKETLFIYLLIAFDCLDYKLLTARPNAYSFNLSASGLIHDCLSSRKQRMKNENN